MTGNLEKVTGNIGAAAGAVTGNLGAAAGNLGAAVGLPKFGATSRRTDYEEISDAAREKAEHMLEIAQVGWVRVRLSMQPTCWRSGCGACMPEHT